MGCVGPCRGARGVDDIVAIDQTEARLQELMPDWRRCRDASIGSGGWCDVARDGHVDGDADLAELHDFVLASARALMAYLGLVPGEDSSGEKHRRGRITRAGNAW